MNRAQQKQYDILQEMLEKRGFAMLDDHYVNANAKINIECEQGHQYEATSVNIKRAIPCPKCKLESGPKGRLNKIVRERQGKLLTGYMTSKTKVKIECSEGHIWEMLPDSIEKGGWCPECKKDIVKEKLLDHVTSRGGKIIREGRLSKDEYTFECQKGHRWEALRRVILKGHWCPRCAMCDPGDAALRFRENIENRGGIVLGTYINNRTKVLVRCMNQHEYLASPINVYQGNNCRQCVGIDFDSCMERLEEYILSRNGVLLSDYANSKTRVKLKCENGHVWKATPNNLVSKKSWCPICNESKGEKETIVALDELGIGYETESRLACTGRKKYDFYFYFEGNCYLLEFDGKQHFKKIDFFHKSDDEFKFKQNVDRLKTYVALNLGYKVIRIDYHSINRIKEIVDEALNSERNLYLSDPEMYDWLFEGLPRTFLESECDTSELIELIDNEIVLI